MSRSNNSSALKKKIIILGFKNKTKQKQRDLTGSGFLAAHWVQSDGPVGQAKRSPVRLAGISNIWKALRLNWASGFYRFEHSWDNA